MSLRGPCAPCRAAIDIREGHPRAADRPETATTDDAARYVRESVAEHCRAGPWGARADHVEGDVAALMADAGVAELMATPAPAERPIWLWSDPAPWPPIPRAGGRP